MLSLASTHTAIHICTHEQTLPLSLLSHVTQTPVNQGSRLVEESILTQRNTTIKAKKLLSGRPQEMP